jgi:hypothetical protein
MPKSDGCHAHLLAGIVQLYPLSGFAGGHAHSENLRVWPTKAKAASGWGATWSRDKGQAGYTVLQ